MSVCRFATLGSAHRLHCAWQSQSAGPHLIWSCCLVPTCIRGSLVVPNPGASYIYRYEHPLLCAQCRISDVFATMHRHRFLPLFVAMSTLRKCLLRLNGGKRVQGLLSSQSSTQIAAPSKSSVKTTLKRHDLCITTFKGAMTDVGITSVPFKVRESAASSIGM